MHYYPAARQVRKQFLVAALRSNNPRLSEQLVLSGFVSVLFSMLGDTTHVEVINKILPLEFAVYNQRYVIRDEALDLLLCIIESATLASPLVSDIIREAKQAGLVFVERDRLWNFKDR
jgi:hypothetical protein